MVSLSPEILRLISINLNALDLSAFAMVSKSHLKAADARRLRSIHVTTLPQLEHVCQTILDGSRDVAAALRDWTIRIDYSGKGKGRDDARALVPLAIEGSPTVLVSPTTRLLCHALRRASHLTKLVIRVSPSSPLTLDDILPWVASASLRSLVVDTLTPLSRGALEPFLIKQSRLSHLELPGQHQSMPKEPSVVTPPTRQSCEATRQIGPRKRLRLATPSPQRPFSVPHPLLEYPSVYPPGALRHLNSVYAPASFILGLPVQCPLQCVSTSDRDLLKPVQRRLFEKLGQHGIVTGITVSRLSITLGDESVGLGVIQEITRNLRELEFLTIKAFVRDAYFTVSWQISNTRPYLIRTLQYLLQDLTGCLSRCRALRSVVFEAPPQRVSRPPVFASCQYRKRPSSDPSIPLPPIMPTMATLELGYPYSPSGPEVYRREQYLVNLYGKTNPCLREVMMPSGTIWRWGPDNQLSPAVPQSLLPIISSDVHISPVVPSSPTASLRSSSPPFFTAWSWEPDRACVEARAWWEEWGLKPLGITDPDETEVDDDSVECDETDVDEEDEDEDMAILFEPSVVPTKVPSSVVPSSDCRGFKRSACEAGLDELLYW